MKILTAVFLLFITISTPCYASVTIYYFTEPVSGHPGYGDSEEEACSAVSTTGGGKNKGVTRTITTELVGNRCAYVITDTYDGGRQSVNKLEGAIKKFVYNCPGKLKYSLTGHVCE